MIRNYERWKKWKNGASIKEIADEEGVTYSSIRSAILKAERTVRQYGEPSEWTQQFSNRVALVLWYSGIKCEADIYTYVDTGVCLPVFRQSVTYDFVRELNNTIAKKIDVRAECREWGKPYLVYKAPKRIKGEFHGLVNGKEMWCTIDGDLSE